jgi:restriction endonuclease S subunit
MVWDELPERWELNQLADVAQDVQTGFACSARDEEGLPHLRPNNVGTDGKLDLSLVKRVPFEAGDLSRYDLKPEDVLFNNTNSQELVGKTAIFDLEGTYSFSNHLTRIRVRVDLLIPEWLSLWFQHLWHTRYFERICNRWIGQAGINTEKLSGIEIPLPSLPEQRRIVARIEELTERIDAARRLRAEAAEEAAAILLSALAEVFGEAEEKGWEVRQLHEVCFVIPGQHILSDDYDTSGEGVGYITGPADFGAKFATVTKWTRKPKVMAKLGDVLLTVKGAGVGKVNCAVDAAIGRQVMAIRPHTGHIERDFVYYYLSTLLGYFQTIATGATVPGIRKLQIQQLRIPVPPVDEQRRIVKHLDSVQAKVEAIRRYQEETQREIEAMTGAVLERAFRGEL